MSSEIPKQKDECEFRSICPFLKDKAYICPIEFVETCGARWLKLKIVEIIEANVKLT